MALGGQVRGLLASLPIQPPGGPLAMEKRYDLVVIGTGVAATTVASRVRQAGWSVAIVDFRPFGGTCVLRGCDPKKVLMSGAQAVTAVEHMRGHGVAGDVSVRWPELMAFKRTFTDPIPAQRAKTFAEEGIEAYRGHARFIGNNVLDVEGTPIEARHVLLAVGAEPVRLGVPGEEYLITNEEFLSLERIPGRVAFVGGGYIAAEFSNIAARAGARVTVLQKGPRMLTGFDPDLVGWLMESFAAAGIEVRTGATVGAIERSGTAFRVRISGSGTSETIAADLVVHAAGRVPALAGLDLAKANIAVKQGRLELNESLQSVSNPAVYAAGDAAQRGPPLTPIASYDAEIVADNLLENAGRKASYLAVPSVAFTLPPIAGVGMSEQQAKAGGSRFRVHCNRTSGWYTARRLAEPVYGYKVLIEEQTDRILGAHLVGPDAEETINLFALAIRHGLTAADLKAMIFTYPTAASDIPHML